MAEARGRRLDFKWTDHVPATAEGIDFLDQGDSAPNARFNYRFIAPAVSSPGAADSPLAK